MSSSVRPGVSTSFNESRTVASSGSNGGGVRDMASLSVRAVVDRRGQGGDRGGGPQCRRVRASRRQRRCSRAGLDGPGVPWR
ncbi:hypothetical protein ACGFY7_18920 [Streptomyces prunicolor]|uniref:hypothetical protein n=1 Tax=Streptomyces prunicolor TaxID=67348 RepID=UPI0037192322